MGPTSGAFQQRVKRRPILRVQFREFSTKLIETFDLIFEGRQRVRQTPDIDFQPLQPLGKSVGISD
jgi:hypothetical protein